MDTRKEIEEHLIQRNKRNLQQVAKYNGTPMQKWFQKMIGGDGYSQEGSNILDGKIAWSEVPDDMEVK